MYDLQVVWGVPRQDTSLYETGPWGGEGGRPWDDGLHTGVKQIRLTRGDAICSIQFLYVQNDRSVWSTIHGIASNINTYHVIYPDSITSLSMLLSCTRGSTCLSLRYVNSVIPTFHLFISLQNPFIKFGKNHVGIGFFFMNAMVGPLLTIAA